MLVIAFVLALLVIAVGMKLLIQVQKELLGHFYKYTTWFIIGMGFFMLIVICFFGMMKFFYHVSQIKNGHAYKMEDHMEHHMMMHGKGYHMGGYSGSRMGEYDDDDMKDCCCYDEKSGEECHFHKRKWDEDSEEGAIRNSQYSKRDSLKRMK